MLHETRHFTSSPPKPRWLALAIGLLTSSAVLAGPIFLPGEIDQGAFVARKETPANYAIQFSDVSADVDNAACRLTLRETIVGSQQAVQTVCLIPLPAGSSPQNAEVSIRRGDISQNVKSARYLNVSAAQKLYETIAKQTGSVEIVALSGQPALLIPQVKLQGRMEMTVSFHAPVQQQQGVLSLVCPMPETAWSSTPVSRATVTATVKSKQPLRAVFSPSHETTIKRDGLHQAIAQVKADNWTNNEPFRLCWAADENALGLRVLTFRDDPKDGGYFLLVGNPTGGVREEKTIDKDILFVLDTSGSMRGEKIEQCRVAIEYCLTRLNPGDRFNIVTFGTDAVSFQEQPVARSPQTTAAAQSFVEDIIARGRTNIGGALAKSLAGKPQKGRPRMVIFLTDGAPTAGEQNPEKILEGVSQWNTSNARVFVIGVGDDVDAHLLDNLAESTGGVSEYITPEEEIDAKVAALYDRLSHPVLTNVKLDFGDLATASVYPRKLPALFKGSEFMIFGRYRGGGRHTVSVRGMLNGVETQYQRTAEFPKTPGADHHDFVAPLWAARNIGFLLQEIRLHGENEELLQEVVRLSKKFGIVTEYTEFLGAQGSAMTVSGILAEARSRVAMANQFKAGRWAVQQARNDRGLQMKAVAGNAANVYLDRRGKKVGRENIYQLGAQCFYLRGGQWCDANEAGKRKERVVELFSEEYFQLLREHPEFAKAQKLGWAMSVNIGEERIIVEKEGKRKSEELLKRSQTQQPIQQIPRNQLQQQQIQQFQRRGINRLNLNNERQLQQIPLQQIPLQQFRNRVPQQEKQQ